MDHIASNINLYMSSSELSQPVEVNEQEKVSSKEQVKRSSEKQNKRNVDAETKSKGDNGASVSVFTHTEVNERPIKSHENRRKRGWNPSDYKPLREVKETPRHQSKYDERADCREVQNSQFKGKSVLKRPHSLEPWAHRFQDDEGHLNKRMSSPIGVHAPQQLLQSTVREAVGPNGPANSKRSESSSKRLRSVVSTTVEGVGNADLILLVTTRPMTRNTLAWSVECEHDQWGHVIAGHVNVAPRHLTTEAETLLFATLIHEGSHLYFY